MRHKGTKVSKARRFAGYRWYDHATGRIDTCRLAQDAMRDEQSPLPDEAPAWLADLPAALPDATPVDLARLEARARRAFVLRDSKPSSDGE